MVPESFAMSRVLAALWFTGLVCQPKPASSRICAMAAGPERKVQVPVLAAGVEAAKITGSCLQCACAQGDTSHLALPKVP